MSGVPVPVYIITQPFGNDALPPTDPGGATLPIPVPSQTGLTVGAASFADGFPPATMVDPETEGGVPPFGQDVNGIIYMLSAYCALLQAGQIVNYSAAASTAFTGYKVGAKVMSTEPSSPGLVWTNLTDGNTNDPDVDMTGWYADVPLLGALAPPAGPMSNVVLPGASDFYLEIDTTAGAVDISGFIAQRNGQKLFISNVGANLLQILANNAGSAADNRIRAPTDLALVTNQTLTLQWAFGPNKWLLV